MNSGQPLRLELRGSVPFALIIVAVHGVGALCFLTLSTAWTGSALAALTFALGLAAAWDRALLRSRKSPRRIEIHPGGGAVCILSNGAQVTFEQAGGTVSRLWVACKLHSAGRRGLLVVPGMLAPDAFRLLRLWARWRRLPAVVSGQRPA